MRKLMVAAVVAALLACAGGAQAKSLTLQYNFVPGQIDNYKMVTDMKLSVPEMMTDTDKPLWMRASILWRQKVLGILPDGSAKIAITYKDMTVSMPGVPAAGSEKAKLPKNASVTVVVESTGRVIGMEGLDKALGGIKVPGLDMGKMFMFNQVGMYGPIAFPEGPVEVGQGWVNTFPMPGNSGEIRAISTLDAAAVPYGKLVAAKITQNMNGQVDLAKMLGGFATQVPASQRGGPDLGKVLSQMKGNMGVSGSTTSLVSAEKGKLFRSDGKYSMMVTMSMPQSMVPPGSPTAYHMILDLNTHIVRIN